MRVIYKKTILDELNDIVSTARIIGQEIDKIIITKDEKEKLKPFLKNCFIFDVISDLNGAESFMFYNILVEVE